MNEALIAVVGNDATIVNDAVHDLITELLEGLDPAVALEDFALKAVTADEEEARDVVSRVLEALNTPPFLVSRRVVVLRDVQTLGAESVGFFTQWADSPTPGIYFVVSQVSTRSPNKLIKAATRVVNVAVGSRAKDRVEFVLERFETHQIKATNSVAQKVADRLGDDVARVDSLARTLHTIYGTAPLNFEQIEPYLGDAGDVPEWDLTDAIDEGKVAAAITTARRMLDSKGRVGVQIVNLLQRHYLRMARLDGSGAASGEDAAKIIGGHAFPAQKLVRSARLLGTDRIAHAVSLVARADRDLKGGASYGQRNDSDVDVTDLTVIEVLVARLAKISESARRG